jgi:hypothetical protein
MYGFWIKKNYFIEMNGWYSEQHSAGGWKNRGRGMEI